MRDKNAISTGVTILLIFLVAGAVGGIVYGVVQSQRGDVGEQIQLAGGCEVEPYIDINAVDGINKGTEVSLTNVKGRKADAFLGQVTLGSSGTKFVVGDKLELILNLSNKLDSKVEKEITQCGANTIQTEIFATDVATMQIKGDTGLVLSDATVGGVTNQTARTTVIQTELKLTANSDESLGDAVCVIEAENDTEVNNIVLSGEGVTKVSVPESYVDTSTTDNIVKAFDVDNAPIDGTSKTYFISMEPESSQTIGVVDTFVNATCYTKQWFVDTDGTFQYGIEDADGTAKYEDVYSYAYSVTA